MRFLLLLSTALMIPAANTLARNSDFPRHTHTHTPIELSSISSLSNAGVKLASVCFMGYGACDPNIGFGKDNDYTVDTEKQCLNEGFKKQNCSSVQVIDEVCPYHPSYGKACKCSPQLITCPAGQVGVGEACGGKYASCACDAALIACPSNKNGTGAYCDGKYQGCSCKAEYQYTSSNCTSPRSVSGAACDGKYTGCVCPAGVTSLPYGCEEYYSGACNSVCKKAYPDNCRNRTAVQIPYGCAANFADCDSKCQTAYPDNCRNRDSVSAPYGCKSAWGDCASKCQVANTDNCHNRTAVSPPYGCQQAWADCPSKCQIAYTDNCRNRSAVASPHGCQTLWADCTSKCQTPKVCKIGDIYYSDGICSANVISGKKALGVVVYITDGGLHGQVIAPKSLDSKYIWHKTRDVMIYNPLQKSYPTEVAAAQDFNSCENTKKLITNIKDGHSFPAAQAAYAYIPPTPETFGKWCLPAAGVVSSWYKNMYLINISSEKIGGSYLNYADPLHLSSTVDGTDFPYVLVIELDNPIGLGNVSGSSKINVRPVMEF